MVDTAITTYANIIQDGIENGELSNAINPVEFATRMMLSIEGGNAISQGIKQHKTNADHDQKPEN